MSCLINDLAHVAVEFLALPKFLGSDEESYMISHAEAVPEFFLSSAYVLQ
jgi:hypothetical protein